MKMMTFVFIMLLGIAPAVYADSVKDFSVEGVMHEPGNPAESIIVIDGELLHEGDVHRGVKIEMIEADHAVATDEETGEEVRIEVTGGRTAGAGQLDSPGFMTLEDRMGQDSQQAPNPVFEFFRNISEVGLVSELRKIHIAAMVYYADIGQDPTVSMKKLVDQGMLSGAYANGTRAGYRINLKATGDGVQLSASPEGPGKSRHFFMDEDGALFFSDSGPATASSREYHSFFI